MAPTWNPTNPDEQQIKEAFAVLSRVTDKVVLPSAAPGQSNRFILRSKSVYDFQAFVLSGKDFHANQQMFEARVSKTAFRKLSEFDPQVQPVTLELMVGTGVACTTFHQNHLPELVMAAQAAVQFSDTTLELLVNGEEINLFHNLSILTDEKYTASDRVDGAYRKANQAAHMVLSMLIQEARDKHRRTENITQSLSMFLNVIRNSQSQFEYLNRQFKTGPVVNQAADKSTPYLEYLNKDLATSLATFSNVEKNTATAIGTYKYVGLGRVAISLESANSGALRGAHETLQNQVFRHRQGAQEETDLIIFVSEVLAQRSGIDKKLADTISAMMELGFLFRDQSECYERISQLVHRIQPNQDLEALKSRKMFIQYHVETCANKLIELKALAQEFTRSFGEQGY
ncbi:hypothetical protein FAVG1_02643 [Fusarium avenaceum]|nr:hypothetical protein FAVG1_02643 [Fusarium avenaceum]